VFQLLETIYHAYDVIAKKRGVFKGLFSRGAEVLRAKALFLIHATFLFLIVETVGDCYVGRFLELTGACSAVVLPLKGTHWPHHPVMSSHRGSSGTMQGPCNGDGKICYQL
jgi:hypothetical protein